MSKKQGQKIELNISNETSHKQRRQIEKDMNALELVEEYRAVSFCWQCMIGVTSRS